METDKPKLEKVGVLWINKADTEKIHGRMTIGQEKYILFPNTYKKQETEPDWNIYKDRPK